MTVLVVTSFQGIFIDQGQVYFFQRLDTDGQRKLLDIYFQKILKKIGSKGLDFDIQFNYFLPLIFTKLLRLFFQSKLK